MLFSKKKKGEQSLLCSALLLSAIRQFGIYVQIKLICVYIKYKIEELDQGEYCKVMFVD